MIYKYDINLSVDYMRHRQIVDCMTCHMNRALLVLGAPSDRIATITAAAAAKTKDKTLCFAHPVFTYL